ncbi:hypothetical protein CEXT_526931 [Caerostris extrusa]|uniref:Uncharacterized protein n=1 Tax=Caerostris extrusa TaxID=172846 RepID=A0AAV4VDF3_CAEEX|nr:hypothetical protein CEXT_526931 [Caerostris extrusa]
MDDQNLDLDCESMLQALTFYNKIIEHSDSKDFKKGLKKIYQALITEAIAKEFKNNLPVAKATTTITKSGNKSFAAAVAKTNPIRKDPQPLPKPKAPPKRQHLAVVKPVNDQSSSANTRNYLQKNIDINRLKIGVKKVSPLKTVAFLLRR